MPSADFINVTAKAVLENEDEIARTRCIKPLVNNGVLDQFEHSDLTPVIGRVFDEKVQLKEFLSPSTSEELFKDLALTISDRGVVFFTNQDINPEQMKAVIERISKAAGSPESSTLHIHPLTEQSSELGDQVSVISSTKQAKGGGLTHQLSDVSRFASTGWHADITFERVPSDYAMLKIHTLPETGGDTLWASGNEIYERLSPKMKEMLEGLTATHDASFFHDEARRLGQDIREDMRGSPLNIGKELSAVHPVVRTNPVTGKKSLFINQGFTRRLHPLTKDESDLLLPWLKNLVPLNHDAQVRWKWSKNDVAIWDNRSNWHCATYDYAEARAGDRVCSLGEKPYL
ncbi:hypothetical protein BGAL_0194g00140 [Botrytis galanthina]|uniref:TauD/TfdA-like domain-containing protein n=1 Tax=Botrytis galanthina TaxID=278940 RepID=A0A4S8R0G7_9HELO|nr:hypothetical protein BGAL_0194g00140 [Botrytis galanthina]